MLSLNILNTSRNSYNNWSEFHSAIGCPILAYYFTKSTNIFYMSAFAIRELEDLNWFPERLRNYQTDFVGAISTTLRVYKSFADYLKLNAPQVKIMKDLCAGSGAPAVTVFESCGQFEHLLLTDKFPRKLQREVSNVSYASESFDVLNIFYSPGVCYTMFNAFHHFNDEEKKAIVKKIRVSGSHAYFVEILEPTFACLLKVIALTTIGVVLFTPFIRPFSLTRLILTYIVPVNIITITIDGIISVMRSKSASEYTKLFAYNNDSVNVFELKHLFGKTTVIEILPAP